MRGTARAQLRSDGGCVPLYRASGAGAAARRILGTVVVSGMLAATVLAIFLIPVLYVVVERIAGGKPKVSEEVEATH